MTHARAPRSQVYALGLYAAVCLVGCRNLDSFNSKPGEAYCGSIGSPLFQDGFVKENSMPRLELALILDVSQLSSVPSADANDGSFVPVGFLLSQEGDPNTALCGDQALFENAPLRAIPQVDRDVLSTLTFGEGHDRDFFAWVDSSCQGTMLAIVSLLKNSQVELRLFKPARLPAPEAKATERPGFAVFHLNPKSLYASADKGGCDFPNP